MIRGTRADLQRRNHQRDESGDRCWSSAPKMATRRKDKQVVTEGRHDKADLEGGRVQRGSVIALVFQKHRAPRKQW
ncbi:hypothetical protein [Mesorhizobium sp. M0800]|uniref:hypothetical protein n=1 Tax=Mesorhizobium sp. M0800 TaxID=2957000 RepID=UPI00333A3117